LASATQAAYAAADLARKQYVAGLVGYQTVLDTERSMLSAEDSLKVAEAEGTTALIRLYKALGGGWTEAPPQRASTTGSEES
jgi:outer membrane protein TolC